MTFGKRPAIPSADTSLSRSPSPQPSDLRAELAARLQQRRDAPAREGQGSVPTSTVAFLTASLAVMVVHMAILLIGKNRFAAETAEILHTIGYGTDSQPFATLALFASVWSGARAAAAFTLPAHLILRALDIRDLQAYAFGASATSAIWLAFKYFSHSWPVGLMAMGGQIPSPTDWVAACASGLVAGTIYRLVAGSRRRD
jgi:hypothetical protein